MIKSLSIISILLVMAGISFAATGLQGCQEISTAGQYYLTGDVSGGYVSATPYTGVACFKITTDNVELDCRGNDLIGPVTEDSYGVLVPSDLLNITIKNCTMTDFGYGIFTRGSNSQYSYITATNNMVEGLRFYRVSGSSMQHINANFNHLNGVTFSESDFNNVINMNANANTNNGIYVINSDDNVFENVVSDDNLRSGVEILYGSGNDMRNAILDNNAFFGIYMLGGGYSTMTNVDATNNDIYGAYLAGGTSDIEFSDLDASLNLGDGLNCNDCHNIDIDNSFFNDNGVNGISVLDASGLDVIHSMANDNKQGWGVIAEQLDVQPGALGLGSSKINRNAAGGIKLVNSSYVNITNLRIINNTGTGIVAIGEDYGHIYVTQSELQGGVDGAALTGAEEIVVEDNNISYFPGVGLRFNDCLDVRVENQDIRNGAEGISVSDTAESAFDNVNITGMLHFGLIMDDVDDVEMTRVSSNDNGLDGFSITDFTNVHMNLVNANNNGGDGSNFGSLFRLSSGLRINGAKDDPAGLIGNDGTGLKIVNVTDIALQYVDSESNGEDGVNLRYVRDFIALDSRNSVCYNTDNGFEIANSTNVSIYNHTVCDNGNAGLLIAETTDATLSNSDIYGNLYGIWFDTSATQFQTTQTNVNNENNTIADEYVELVTDTDGDGVPDDEDDCPTTYGTEGYNGCPAAIYCKITSNDVLVTGLPGQQPVDGALCKSYKRTDSCVATRHPDSTLIVEECEASSSCVTDSQGLCLMGVEEAQYYVAAVEPQHPGKYPGHDIGLVDSGSSPKMARLAFLRGPDGKTSPGKSSKKSGSELWVYEPQYVVWEGTEEYYPFVFESEQNWAVDVCLEPPEGYVPSDNEECVQQVIAGQPKSILFKLVEVGSVPDDVKVKMKFKTPKGKSLTVHSKVGTRLSQNLAKAKGVAIDKNGVVTGKAAHAAGLPVNPLFVVLLIGVGLAAFVVDSFRRSS